jgi:hypothetical protein
MCCVVQQSCVFDKQPQPNYLILIKKYQKIYNQPKSDSKNLEKTVFTYLFLSVTWLLILSGMLTFLTVSDFLKVIEKFTTVNELSRKKLEEEKGQWIKLNLISGQLPAKRSSLLSQFGFCLIGLWHCLVRLLEHDTCVYRTFSGKVGTRSLL